MSNFKLIGEELSGTDKSIVYNTILNIAFDNEDVSRIGWHGFEFNFQTLTSNCGRYELLYLDIDDCSMGKATTILYKQENGFEIHAIRKSSRELDPDNDFKPKGDIRTYKIVVRRKLPTETAGK